MIIKLMNDGNVNTPKAVVPQTDGVVSPESEAAVIGKIVKSTSLLRETTALRIVLLLLNQGEKNVGEIVRALNAEASTLQLPEENQPNVSRYIAHLRANEWLLKSRRGQHNFYSVSEKLRTDLVEVITQLRMWAAQPQSSQAGGAPENNDGEK